MIYNPIYNFFVSLPRTKFWQDQH